MMDFEDEFTESTSVKKPETPAQYVKLDDSELVKRDLDTFPEFLKEKALDKYKLISFIEQENSAAKSVMASKVIMLSLKLNGSVINHF
ncbi:MULTISPECIES: hypothetical protein [unclassified Shewanella]|uniref:hypothetical protein n=1 Tax=unclassified Shewanella TaxID=196818 RepID=UPI000CBBD343|nr:MULTISPECIES: hypothetical protein [unclassified Shewanella]MDO6619938.1 hypothetical protein [Shewanella sp. 6_MG-2023]PMH86162.1 hypothetical protein BCU57_11765 [Shewanella sp. 10N.286.48.B5]